MGRGGRQNFLGLSVYGQSCARRLTRYIAAFSLGALFTMIGGAMRLSAAIPQGPASTNVSEDQRFAAAKVQAMVSLQHKDQVARARYADKQNYRHSVVAGMEGELAERQEMISAGGGAADGIDGAAKSGAGRWLMWGVPGLIVCLIGYHYYRNRDRFATGREWV